MGKKLMFVEVRGREKLWSFEFYGDPRYLPDWHADGLTVEVIEYIVPQFVPWWAVRAWAIITDLFNFRNPWRK